MEAIITAVSVTDVVAGVLSICGVIALVKVAAMGGRKLLAMIR